jgi:hypothetical protein
MATTITERVSPVAGVTTVPATRATPLLRERESWRFSYSFDTLSFMGESTYSIGEGPATRVSLSLPEGTAEAIRARVGRREFSAFIAEAVERELRGHVLDEYLADYESRKGPVSEQARQRARQVFDGVFAEEDEWPAAG